MPRRNAPAKQPKPESKSLSRFVDRIQAWQVLVAAAIALLGAGWWARARASEFATKDEVSQAQLIIQQHNAELSAINQALKDIRWDIQQLLPKK